MLQLTDEQLKVINAVDGKYVVLAGAGSGKTKVLVERTAKLILDGHAKDEDIMLVTDTGTIIRLNSGEVSVLGRSTQGVTLMRTNEGKVVSIEKILDEDENYTI